MTSRRRFTADRLVLLVLLVLLVVTVAGCGSGSSEPSETTSPSGPPSAPTMDRTAATAATAATTTTDVGRDGSGPDASRPDAAASDPTVASTAPTTTTTPAGAGPSSSTSAPASPAQAAAAPSRYVPAAGTYRYDVSGYRETTGVGGGRERLPPSSTDTITVAATPTGQEVTVVTRDEGSDSSQEVVVVVDADEARLARLTWYPDRTSLGYDVRPDPPAMLARFPYRTGDEWEIAWTDRAAGVSGTGRGSVSRPEVVTTPLGEHEAVVIRVTQRLRGTVTGTLDVTSWIDPETGIQVKQHVVTELSDATGASRTDATRLLREVQS